jgi:hypothetical protein
MLRSINPKGSWLESIGIKFVSESVYEIRTHLRAKMHHYHSNNSTAIPLLQPVILLRDIPLGNGFLAF